MGESQIRGLCLWNLPQSKPSLKYQTRRRWNDFFQYLSYIAVSDIRLCEHGSAAGQWGDGATVSFNAVNSPAFSSSLATPFFVPGHLIAALIYGSTRLPLPIYRYFMKITPLNRVNVCFFSTLFSPASPPRLMWAPKLCGVPCINFCDIRRIRHWISLKAQRDGKNERRSECSPTGRVQLVHAAGMLCACLPPTWMALCQKAVSSFDDAHLLLITVTCLLRQDMIKDYVLSRGNIFSFKCFSYNVKAD